MKPNLPTAPGSNPRDPRIVSAADKGRGTWFAVDRDTGRVLGSGSEYQMADLVQRFPDTGSRGLLNG